MKIKYITNSKDETQELASKLARNLKQGDVFLLIGNLGSGKTTFVQGLAKGLGIKEKVNSPTFVIMKQYEGRIPLVHIDAYRLEGVNQDLGFDDYYSDSATVIEWPQFYLDDIENFNKIYLYYINENSREIIFEFEDDELLKGL